MKIHQLTADEAIKSLHSGPQGLSHAAAAGRLLEYGPNRVEEAAREHLVLRLLREFTHFFALILWLAAVLAFVAEFYDPGKGMAMLGVAMLGVIVVNGLFSFWQEHRAEEAIAALRQLLPAQVVVVRENENLRIPAEELVPGDIVHLGEGDRVPADCRLIEAFGVRVNNATVTGESLPKARNAEPGREEELMEGGNILFTGTSLVSGEAKAVVFATGMHTEFGKIAHLTQAPREALSPLQREIGRLSRLVALLATILGIVFFIIGQFIGLTFWENFIFAIGIIVANVPEGLLPTLTLSLAMATQRMAKRNALIRHLPAVETLGSTSVICTDKTGTLTQNIMQVKRLFLGGAFYGADEVSPALRDSHRSLFETAGLCHNLKAVNGGWLGDPMEVALARMAQGVVPELAERPRVGEIPFDTDRKRMSVVVKDADGLVLHCKGALEKVLPLCSGAQTGNGVLPLDDAWKRKLLEAQDAMADQGLRILAFAFRRVSDGEKQPALEHDLILTGLAGLEDPPRPEVPEAIAKCHAAGIKVIMVTGDHPHTATAIAREIGLAHAPVVITGEQLRRYTPAQLQLALDAPEIIFARVGADQKMLIVNALKRKKHIVAVTGDGVNDAPALKQAHIGIAMGIAGADVTREVADMVLLDDNFASIVSAIEEGRAVFDNIRKFLVYILTHNVAELVPYLAFAAFKIPLPLTVIQILVVDLGTDTLPALGLGAEKPDAAIMQRPPRPRAERLLNWSLIARAYLFLGVMEAAAAMAAFFYVLHEGGWNYGEVLAHNAPLYLQATTATLSAIIVMQVVNVFLCRSTERSILASGLSGNRLLLGGVAAEIVLILLIDYTRWGNAIFGTSPIALGVWLYVIPFALAMLVLEEARKRLFRAGGS
ncbi:MAG TPA: cation-transporting P-type ATPase [Gallionellaceae bacterium]